MKTSSRLARTGTQLVEGDTRVERQVTDACRVESGDQEGTVLPVPDAGPGRPEDIAEPVAPRRTHEHSGDSVRTDEISHRRVGDELAPADDHQVGGGQRHLAHQMAGHKDGPTLGGQRLQEIAHPEDALGVEPVDRLVEQEDSRVAEESRSDAQALAHPEREFSRPCAGPRSRGPPSRGPRPPGPSESSWSGPGPADGCRPSVPDGWPWPRAEPRPPAEATSGHRSGAHRWSRCPSRGGRGP